MQRVLSTAALLGLLIATAAAFAITERLKLVRSPVFDAVVSKRLSPTCGCARGKAHIRLRLRHGDRVTLWILDSNDQVVRTLAGGVVLPQGPARWVWDGKDDIGDLLPDGVYRPEIHLARQRRTILFPDRISLDTHAAHVESVQVSRGIVSPDGDGVGDSIKIHYRLDSQAHLLVYLGSDIVIRSRSFLASGSVDWLGRDANHQPLPAGNYVLWLGSVDRAGNVTPSYERQPVVVTVRYISLSPTTLSEHPGQRFTVAVDTDAKKWWWKFAGRKGVSSGPTLALHAPTKPGHYRIAVGERRYGARASVVVTAAR
ncbi:MAG TPA: FlgD immunoglobulin-like domain containing protein [Gaiellaceae bacterium]|nr:FlgD immunoglobulin-like domain containing protein [Gaiellaceae bacterium]